MQSAYTMKYNCKKMKKLEKEYAVIKSKEQEEMAELKASNQNFIQKRNNIKYIYSL